MENMYINHFAVFVAALSDFAVGALWYSPIMFFKGWKEANKLTDADLANANPAKTYSLTFVLAVLISYNLAFFLSDAATDLAWGATAGFLAGFGWAAAVFTIIALFEMKSLKYVLINCGYIVVAFTLKGVILGAWR